MGFQPSLDLVIEFPKSAYAVGTRSDGETHGVVHTKPHVVELILDLAGYSADVDLGAHQLLEPSCGEGAFLIAAVQRLLTSAARFKRSVNTLGDALSAFDIDEAHIAQTRNAIVRVLKDNDVNGKVARRLADRWVRRADFLLEPLPSTYSVVVGNPPYIRIEQLSPALQAEYRSRYTTLADRADLYVAFIERSLQLLAPGGILSFVCADRWTLNRYGGRLRELITEAYSVRAYVDLHTATPFETEVVAYPSIFAIARDTEVRPVQVYALATASKGECNAVRARLQGRKRPHPGVRAVEYPIWFMGDTPWVLSSPEQLATLRELEARLPLLEDDGHASVRIGVATGNDSVYIVSATADLEPDRLVPLVMREDIDSGSIRDAGRRVINTFGDRGTINLAEYPRLGRYFDQHLDAIKKRHVAKQRPTGWFRTIDRVYPELVAKPKLLIPDIAGANEVVFDAGNYFPHHNLYFVISDVWDLEVLGALLSSKIALFFVWSYAVKMRGGYLRFQAQYLRRIRVPAPNSVPAALKRQLKAAFRARDFAKLDEFARVAYGLRAIPEFDFVDTRR